MKVRNGFVSNSSSSSFVVFGEPPSEGVKHKQLTEDQIKHVIAFIDEDEYADKKVEWNGKDPAYMTQFISDCCDDIYGELCNNESAYYYMDGNHDGPYGGNDAEYIEEIDEDVYLHKN